MRASGRNHVDHQEPHLALPRSDGVALAESAEATLSHPHDKSWSGCRVLLNLTPYIQALTWD